MKDYEKMSKDELLKVVFQLTSASSKARAYLALKKQVDGIVDYLNNNQLATKQNLSDKEEKTWDRGKSLLKDLTQYTKDLNDLEKTFLQLDTSYIEQAEEGSWESLVMNREKGK